MEKTKVKGFMTLQGVLLVVLLGLLALSFLQIYSSQFSALTANRRAIQAQQFAQSEADFLRNVSYDELDTTAHARQAIAGANGWMSEVSLDAETTVNGVPQRMGNIKVYRNSTVTAPDFSLQVPLSSQGSGTGGEAIGTIVPRLNNNFSNTTEASKYLYCDGSTFSAAAYPKLATLIGTTLPDLRDRVLQGNDIGGTKIEAGLPNIIGYGLYLLDPGELETTGGGAFSVWWKRLPSSVHYGGNPKDDWDMVIDFNASRCSAIYGRSTTVQPPAVTVRYYIRAK